MEKSISYGFNPKSSHVSKFTELFTGGSLLEVCNSFWMRSPNVKKHIQPYLRGCKWSPDGTCCLSVVNQDGFHIMELPRDLYDGCPDRDRTVTLLTSVIHVKESGLVYDFCWYPKMNSHYPETCCWISTKINSPIQMWDAYSGSLRCSYRGFNAVDEMEPAISVAFINQGQRIVGGYRNCLRTFEVERPGRDFLEHKINSPASCFATHGDILAVGSWNANIKLFSILNNGTYRSVGNLYAHTGGITHLQFTPDGTKLVSGARKDSNLCVWDIRYHRRPLNILKRSVSTNQRIYFDISTCGRYLVSGGTDGVVRVWDNKFTKWNEQFNVEHTDQENATFRFQLHHDCCNSISIHPNRPILATGSGQFHFLDPVKVLELERDSGANSVESIAAEPQSDSSESSSDEQISVDNSNIVSTEVHKTGIVDEVEKHRQDESENTPSTVATMESTKDHTDKIYNRDISEEPPAKKSKLDVTPQPSTGMSNIRETLIEEASLSSELEIGRVDKAISDVLKDNNPLPSTTETTVKPYHDCKTQQNSAAPSITKNILVQFHANLNKLQDSNTVPTEEHRNSEISTVTELISSHKSPSRVPEGNTDMEFAARDKAELNLDKSSSKMFNMHHIEKPPDKESIIDNALESDIDYDNIDENKMKYSSNAENNLTFWWIGTISERQT